MTYTISGRIISGDGYGRKIGFPTINLDRRGFLRMKDKPEFGVYAGDVVFNSRTYKAGIIIGPLDAEGLPKIEAHLIGFKSDAYGKQAVFELRKFIRKFKKFKTEKELIVQIEKDLAKCK